MRHQVVAIGLGACSGLLFEAGIHAVVHIPIGGVNGHVADGVAALLELGTKLVAFLRGVAFFQRRITKQAREAAIGFDQRLVALKVGGKIVVGRFGGIEVEMRIGMTADQVPGVVPLPQELLALCRIHPHAADEQSSLETPFFECIEYVAIGLAPGDVSTQNSAGVVHGDRNARLFGRGGAERESGGRYKGCGAAEEFTAIHTRALLSARMRDRAKREPPTLNYEGWGIRVLAARLRKRCRPEGRRYTNRTRQSVRKASGLATQFVATPELQNPRKVGTLPRRGKTEPPTLKYEGWGTRVPAGSKAALAGGADRGADRGRAGGGGNGREPVVPVGFGAGQNGEEFVLETLGDRAAATRADGDAVDRTQGRDFRGGAGEEDFVGDVEHLARNHLLADRNAKIFAKCDDAAASDAGQDARGQRRRMNGAIADNEDIFAGTFADVAVRIERDALGIAIGERFHADKLRIHVIRAGFGDGRKGVRRQARPGTDANVHALLERFGAEIGSPFPAGQVNFDGAGKRIDVDVGVAANHQRADVTGAEAIFAHDFVGGRTKLLDRVGALHALNMAGVDQALHVFAQAKSRRAMLGFVAADALKNRRAVADDVGEHIDLRFVPGDQFAVVPDPFGLFECHRGSLLSEIIAWPFREPWRRKGARRWMRGPNWTGRGRNGSLYRPWRGLILMLDVFPALPGWAKFCRPWRDPSKRRSRILCMHREAWGTRKSRSLGRPQNRTDCWAVPGAASG